MSFTRVLPADVVAAVAALALLFTMALDWYSTAQGEEARRQERLANPEGALGGEVERETQREASEQAEEEEQNAWQASGLFDRLILAGLLATVALAIAAAFMRAAGRRYRPPLTPSGLAGIAAVVTALLVTFRAVQQPGLDAGTRIKAGVPLSVAMLGIVALAVARTLRREEREPAEEQPEPEPEPREQPA